MDIITTSSSFLYRVMGKEPTGRFNTLYTAVKFTAGTNLAGWFNGGAGIFIQNVRVSYYQNILDYHESLI